MCEPAPEEISAKEGKHIFRSLCAEVGVLEARFRKLVFHNRKVNDGTANDAFSILSEAEHALQKMKALTTLFLHHEDPSFVKFSLKETTRLEGIVHRAHAYVPENQHLGATVGDGGCEGSGGGAAVGGEGAGGGGAAGGGVDGAEGSG
jgi:uncharacterized membrane protein YgcG